MKRIIPSERSIIVAADVPSLDDLTALAKAMKDVNGIGGFKLGFTLAMQGLEEAAGIVRHFMGPAFPVIYDHQKAGTDIPETGKGFAKALKQSGINAAILFPFAGAETHRAWTEACFGEGLEVITGGVMTHAKFLQSEGGYIADSAVLWIYRNACRFGCRHFVVPGNKIDWVTNVRAALTQELKGDEFVLYAPGFITQKGDISECGQAAGKEWHAIVGSAIYTKPSREEMRQAAVDVTKQIIAISV